MLPRDQIHFFSDIGYQHTVAARCPSDYETVGKCVKPFLFHPTAFPYYIYHILKKDKKKKQKNYTNCFSLNRCVCPDNIKFTNTDTAACKCDE